jgi:type IV pilus assembly protein PilW
MKAYQRGFTLIELLISIVIALIISAAIFGIYANSAGSSAAMLKSSKLNQELFSLMLVMSNDIRRAGYWEPADEVDLEEPHRNPFSADETELALIDNYTDNNQVPANGIDPVTGETVYAECILYTFDENRNPTSKKGEPESDEIYGFRFNRAENVVEMRKGWSSYTYDETNPPFVNDDCSVTKGNWDAVTDSKLIKITKLSFSRPESECVYANFPDVNCYANPPDTYKTTLPPEYNVSSLFTVETREVKIELSGELVSDPSVKASIDQIVRVRNDRVKEWPINP